MQTMEGQQRINLTDAERYMLPRPWPQQPAFP